MKYKINRNVYLSIYLGFFLLSFLSAVLYEKSDFFYIAGYFNFGLLLIVILISFAAFLSTVFSTGKWSELQFKTLLIIHGGAFVSFMVYYAVIYI